MNCVYHAEVPNVAFCIRCGHALCNECVRNVRGSVYCETCLAEAVEGKSAAPPPPAVKREMIVGTNPGAAFVLGLKPRTTYQIEVDDQEMAEGNTDSGGILELKLPRKMQTGVRIHEAPAIVACSTCK